MLGLGIGGLETKYLASGAGEPGERARENGGSARGKAKGAREGKSGRGGSWRGGGGSSGSGRNYRSPPNAVSAVSSHLEPSEDVES